MNERRHRRIVELDQREVRRSAGGAEEAPEWNWARVPWPAWPLCDAPGCGRTGPGISRSPPSWPHSGADAAMGDGHEVHLVVVGGIVVSGSDRCEGLAGQRIPGDQTAGPGARPPSIGMRRILATVHPSSILREFRRSGTRPWPHSSRTCGLPAPRWIDLVLTPGSSSGSAPPRHAPRGVLLSRIEHRYPSFVGLATRGS